ncbi:hypothetical protein ERC79_00520 [Rhodococcus sp. ABRD24]|uniref:Acg family FMN-binding oxidoreductase n=1 Tax=Rhodococcus sp. ABRD24 TaxID=2507582 RepID=UPI00103C3675|nr:hypothetical protein [Rhodococcus sp. ABRD24]QBJ94620.1 hypothetical protein ERC79_00520 [Rhodococcus sp. ABRD24]
MTTGPGPDVIRGAVEIACRAPSLHNSQPWLWTYARGALELYADRARSLAVTDPLGRQMLISCGAVLHHCVVAASGFGSDVTVERFPDPQDPMHLATLNFAPSRQTPDAVPDSRMASLRGAIADRRTDRRPFDAPESAGLAGLDAGLGLFASSLTLLGDDGAARLAEASRHSASVRRYDAAYRTELFWWTGHSLPDEGVPPSARPAGRAVPTGREFPSGTLKSDAPGPDRAALAVISTEADTRLDWLRSGEALSQVLLDATARGLRTCPLTHLTEVAASRAMVRDAAAARGERFRFPQTVVRIGTGRNGVAAELSATGRRSIDEVCRIDQAAPESDSSPLAE